MVDVQKLWGCPSAGIAVVEAEKDCGLLREMLLLKRLESLLQGLGNSSFSPSPVHHPPASAQLGLGLGETRSVLNNAQLLQESTGAPPRICGDDFNAFDGKHPFTGGQWFQAQNSHLSSRLHSFLTHQLEREAPQRLYSRILFMATFNKRRKICAQ